MLLPLEILNLVEELLLPIDYIQFRQLGFQFRLKKKDHSVLASLEYRLDLVVLKSIYKDETFPPFNFSEKFFQHAMEKSFKEDNLFFEQLYTDLIDNQPNTVIKALSSSGCVDKIRAIIESSIVPLELDECLRLAIIYNHTSVVQLLLKTANVNPSSTYSTDHNLDPLILASFCGHLEIVRILLSDERVDPSAFFSKSLAQAALKGHVEVVRLLLTDPRIDPSTGDNFPLRYASRGGYFEVVLLLAERVEDGIRIAFRAAAEGNRQAIVLKLLEHGEVCKEDIDYAIGIAFSREKLDFVRLMIDKMK